ncbi:MAG: DPP IV N-terminal domain-containing protein [Myxococcota bacterium]
MEALLMSMIAASTVSDVEFLREYAETRRYLAGRPVSVKVTADSSAALFLRSEAKDNRQMLFELDLATGQTKEWLTPEKLLNGAAEKLSVEEKARLERQRVSARGFTSYQLSDDGARVLVALSGKLYVVNRKDGAVTQLKTGEGACLDPKFSPDGALVAYVRDYDVHVLDLAKNVERRVTKGGTVDRPHGLAEFVAQEEMGRFSGYWLSPDGKRVAYQETDHTGVEQFTIADPMHPEISPDRFYYPRPGKKNATVSLFVQALTGGKPTRVTWDEKAFPYLGTVVWKDGPLTLVVENREQTKVQVLAVDEKTGKTKVLLEEEDAAWIDLDQKVPLWWKDKGFFWVTERHGAPEVELRKADGTLDASWVKPDAGYMALVGFDPEAEALYFLGSKPPPEKHLYKVVRGGAPELLAISGKGPSYEEAVLSGKGKFAAVQSASLASLPRASVVRLSDAKVLAEVPSVALEPKLEVKAEIKKLPGERGAWAMVIRPKDFQPKKKYPVILQVYGGPGHLEVMHVRRENLVLQWLANQGFIVVKADGRGTPGRGRDWERAIKFDFATVTMEDQVAALKALGAEVPELDLSRVGVYGWSFGGYLAALLAMAKGDVVKSAVAGAPVVDWLDYDTHYTERYLGLPDAHPEAYRVSSLLSYVEQAKRPILLMHGTADDNVYFLHTLKLSDALFRAGKPHSVLPLSNFTHMVPEPLVMQRQFERVATFFKETL